MQAYARLLGRLHITAKPRLNRSICYLNQNDYAFSYVIRRRLRAPLKVLGLQLNAHDQSWLLIFLLRAPITAFELCSHQIFLPGVNRLIV